MRLRPTILLLLMLLSGLAGISYEILYGRLFGNMIGDQFIVSAAILITFLLGIGIGARVAWRLVRWLWLIEGSIGLIALLLTAGSGRIEHLLYHAWPSGGMVGSLLFCSLFLLPPSLLVGCSLPIFAQLLHREGLGTRAFPTVYATYNLGAAATALLIEFFLLRQFGVAHTIYAFAAINLIVAVALFVGFRQPVAASPPHAQPWLALPWYHWLALVLASIASAAFQLWAIKIAEMVLGPFRESFAIVLALILTGLVLGALLVRRWHCALATVLVLASVGLVLTLVTLEPLMTAYAYLQHLTIDHPLANAMLKTFTLTGLLLIPATAFGATIPALLQRDDALARDSGQLLFVSALANAGGFLLMALVLHRELSYGSQLLVITAITALALMLAWRQWWRGAVVAAMVMTCSLYLLTTQWNENLLFIGYTSFENRDDLKENLSTFDFADAYRGFQDVFSISWMDDDPFFFINGYISIPLNNPSEKVVGAASSLFAPKLNRALVLGLGSGATASAVGQLFKQTEVVEINPVVRDNLFRMRRWNYDIEHNSRVTIHVDDAIHFLRNQPAPRYDMILNTVTTPLYFSSSKLYTSNFFRDIKKNLNQNGLYVTWVDSRIGDQGTDIILKTLQSSFKYCALLYVKSAYFLLLASDQPIQAFHPMLAADNPLIRDDLWRKHGINAAWLRYQLLTTNAYSLIGDKSVRRNTLDYPALEFSMSSGRHSGLPKFRSHLFAAITNHAMRQAALNPKDWQPGPAILHARKMLHNSSIYRRIRDVILKEEQGAKASWRAGKLTKVQMHAELEPSANHWHRYGRKLLQAKQYAPAAEAFRQALALDSHYPNSQFNLAASLEAMGKLPQALDHYQQELKQSPQSGANAYRVARVLVKMKRFHQAAPWFTRARKLWSKPSNAFLYYRALMEIGLHQHARAIVDLKQALTILPQDRDILDLLIKLSSGVTTQHPTQK
ncbi:MAG: tetratricopeptide repeat protein [Mariprofundales bacterium]|nr:tetratricopeptide repeat protein [Mariprofundales bacterium]